MSKKNFLLFLLVTISGFVFANNTPTLIASSSSFISSPPPCNLPAPENVRYTEFGPDWLVVEWIDLNMGVAHRIKTYTLQGNNLVSNLVAPPFTTSLKIPNLQPGVMYYSTIAAICPDGVESPNIAYTGPGATIVSELVVMGFTNSSSTAMCGVDAPNEFCYFDLSGGYNYFKIRPVNNLNPNLERLFVVSKTNNKLRGAVTSAGGTYTFQIDQIDPTPQGVPGIHFEIYLGSSENPLAGFQLAQHSDNGVTMGKLICEFMTEEYEIVRLAPPTGLHDPSSQALKASKSNERSEESSPRLDVSVSPNPFTETLEVFLPDGGTEKIRLQLFNLSGQKVIDRQFVGKQEKFSLSTTDLSPGFYFLRLEADDVVQTLKVVKSE